MENIHTPGNLLDPGLASVLPFISVSPGGLHGEIGGTELTAESRRQFRQKLASAIYEIFHVGHAFEEVQHRTFRDPWFESELATATPHSMTKVAVGHPGLACSSPIVMIDGVKVRMPATAEGIRGQMLIPAQRPGLSPGFFLVDGSKGRSCGAPLLRVYMYVDGPEMAVRLWGRVLRRLEEASVPYRAKVTSSRRLFPRRDGLVVYLGSEAWHMAAEIAQAASPSSAALRTDRTSSFARACRPGVAIAWEPEDAQPGMDMSFGQHRAKVIADAYLDHMESGEEVPVETHLIKKLVNANIDPACLYRNLDSPDLPFLLQMKNSPVK